MLLCHAPPIFSTTTMSHPTPFGSSEIEPYATTSAKSRINDQEGALAASWRLKGCRSMLARNGIPIFWQFSTFGSYRWKKRKYLNYCETLIKASEGHAHLSDRLLSFPPELQAEIMDYLALSIFEDITNPTAASLRSTAESMLKHLPAIKCEGKTVTPSDALAAIAVEAICKNIPFHFEADFPTAQSPNR